MSTAQKTLLTTQQYLAIERAADVRSEFFQGEMFAMSGATWEHTLIKDNLAAETRSLLRDGPCRIVTSDLRVKVSATGLYTYPDAVIVCGEPKFEDDVLDTLLNPRVIVEVLSDSTEKYDRGTKFAHYRQVPSIEEYVLIAHDRPLIERFVRQKDDAWLMTDFLNPERTFSFGTVDASVPLAEIYQGIKFADPPAR